MSGLVDMWTEKVAKLREKGDSIFSRGEIADTTISTAQASQKVRAQTDERNFLDWSKNADRIRQLKMPALHYSEASVSMLVDCFSP